MPSCWSPSTSSSGCATVGCGTRTGPTPTSTTRSSPSVSTTRGCGGVQGCRTTVGRISTASRTSRESAAVVSDGMAPLGRVAPGAAAQPTDYQRHRPIRSDLQMGDGLPRSSPMAAMPAVQQLHDPGAHSVTWSEPTLFDEPEDEVTSAMRSVESNAVPAWIEEAERIIRNLTAGTRFIGEQIVDKVEERGLVTHDKRAMG